MLILSSHYLPCIEWFHALFAHEEAVIDVHEHFVKQSYRNRTSILSANGKLSLTVPVRKTAHHMPMDQVEIENDFRWQHQHWQAIQSAYSSAPYFLYYQDRFRLLYEKEFRYLLELNQAMLEVCMSIMKIEWSPGSSASYIRAEQQDIDARALISPKKGSAFNGKPYLQVFTDKLPFEKNLSIIDVLFTQGPRWPEYIIPEAGSK